MSDMYKNINETPTEKHARLHEELRRADEEKRKSRRNALRNLYGVISVALVVGLLGGLYFQYLRAYMGDTIAFGLLALVVIGFISSLVGTIVGFVKAKKNKEKSEQLLLELRMLENKMQEEAKSAAATVDSAVNGEKSLFD